MRFDQLLPKWDPRTADFQEEEGSQEGSEDVQKFREPKQISSLTEGFRVFTKPRESEQAAALNLPNIGAQNGENSVTVAFSGSTVNGGTADAKAGIAVFFGEGDPRNESGALLEGLEQSTANAEIAAAVLAMQKTPVDTELRLESQRDVVLKNATKFLEPNEDRGWIGIPNRKSSKALGAALRSRKGTSTTIAVVRNEKTTKASEMSKASARDPTAITPGINLEVAANESLVGAKLSSMTQALAYKGIKELRKKVSRKATNRNVSAVQEELKTQYVHAPTPATIWKSLRNKDITRQIRTFLWKAMHGAHRIGKFWENIPECEDRAICGHCGVTETFEHIILECGRPGQEQVWKLAKELWAKKHSNWPPLSLGTILGCGLAVFEDEKKKAIPLAARLYRILITESMYLIWKLRCECVIGRSGEPPAENEIHNRWVRTINERLEIDISLTNEMKFGKQYSLKPAVVLETWRGTLENEGNMPRNWLRQPEVLVGIASKGSQRPLPPSSRSSSDDEGVG
ncbi:ribonuclease H-like protein [Mycena metata]|uniref:Ribonuclease H-like protein n=2 Tax=Mycena metata TaxID=1033252 RepID=A0AAD7H7N2_9AGAR|nr:ribonuclease H-like protein [Mycena metata]KAJ7714364.1 ribonuclease H-like protein [Mycena metata]